MKLPLDKVLHFLAGSVITSLTYWLLGLWSILLTLIAGVGKELWDYYDDSTKQDVELADMIATVLGGLVTSIAWFVLLRA